MSKKNEKKKEEFDILKALDERLNKLKIEKDEIEKTYGLNETVVKSQKKQKNTEEKLVATGKDLESLKKKNNYEGLPKVEIVKKKEEKKIYSTPETLTDSLKYEPKLEDLIDKNEFSASFYHLEGVKCPPSMNFVKTDEKIIDDYVDLITSKYLKSECF